MIGKVELISLSDSANDIVRRVETHLYGRKVTVTNTALKYPVVFFYDGNILVGIVTERATLRNADSNASVWPELASALPISAKDLDQFGRNLHQFVRSI